MTEQYGSPGGAGGQGGQGQDQGPQGGLAAELSSLKKFKGRVDDLLRTLDESDGSPGKVADTALTQTHLGKGFHAAEALFGVYRDVHNDLVTLAQLLNDQIQALSSAVLDAHSGYANTDAEEREKLWAIHERMQRQYDPKLDPDVDPAKPHTSRMGARTDLRGNSGSGNPTHF
ncbi:hypothetical protein FGW37_12215 [Streptomyces rectiverticillatus]|uniref:hypothetical protein n=1 Tax=Streptomyces rectiverticillatus TaxID=173860 RepID=UPI0015C349E8|nr:hypothetical protein [Streptomyces rectiverticillatus]QLE72263.1 hypothetical protein FGW37_12215 [Streptomyces rectiverticillatus]